jgi:hypothetical protein
MTPILLHLKTCVNVGYYLLVVPMKVQVISENGFTVFKKHTNLCQMVIAYRKER